MEYRGIRDMYVILWSRGYNKSKEKGFMRKQKYIKHKFFGIWCHFMKANSDQSLHDYLQFLF